MWCPHCRRTTNSLVFDTSTHPYYTARKRQCAACGATGETIEMPSSPGDVAVLNSLARESAPIPEMCAEVFRLRFSDICLGSLRAAAKRSKLAAKALRRVSFGLRM